MMYLRIPIVRVSGLDGIDYTGEMTELMIYMVMFGDGTVFKGLKTELSCR